LLFEETEKSGRKIRMPVHRRPEIFIQDLLQENVLNIQEYFIPPRGEYINSGSE
jgi:hypothetical protein